MDALHRADALTVSLPQPWPINPWPTRFRTVRASPDGALDPGLRMVTVQSPALGGRADVAIHHTQAAPLPADVAVVVMLHGVYGSFWNWSLNGGAHEVLDALVDRGEVQPMVLVMPSDGLRGEGTAYLPHGSVDYERWVMHDVVACVREAEDAVDASSPIVIGGASMGGFAALRLGARYADTVRAIAAHSGITDLEQLAAFTIDDIGVMAGVHQSERSVLGAIADRAESMPPIYLDCGRDDPLAEANCSLHVELDRLGIDHEYHEYDGSHAWASWHRRLEVSLRFFDSVLQRRAARS